MKLKIDDNYQITSDTYQYILQEKKVVLEGENKGGDYIVNVGYFGKIHIALQAYKELQIRNSNVTSVVELISLIKDLDIKIETLLKGN